MTLDGFVLVMSNYCHRSKALRANLAWESRYAMPDRSALLVHGDAGWGGRGPLELWRLWAYRSTNTGFPSRMTSRPRSSPSPASAAS